MSRPALPAAELRRFAGSPRALLALFALVLVPLVYGGLYTWANESPTTRVDQIAAAVVNLDEPVTLKGADGKDQIVPLGRVVVGKLTSSASSSNYAWTLTDAATAESGLKEGRFGAVLTIPADFSRSATSTNGAPADARAARLSLRTDDSVNYLDGAIAKAIATTTSAEAARTVTEGYLSAMYAGYGTLHDQLSSAADGAGKLASGVTELTSGADKAAVGAGSLASGVDQIASGAGDLASGADKLATGADQAAAGVGQLAGGLSQIDSKVAAMPAGTRALADGAAQVSAGLTGLSSGAGQTASGAAALATGLTAYTSGVDGLAATCAASGAAPAFCATLAARRRDRGVRWHRSVVRWAQPIGSRGNAVGRRRRPTRRRNARIGGGFAPIGHRGSDFGEQTPPTRDGRARGGRRSRPTGVGSDDRGYRGR